MKNILENLFKYLLSSFRDLLPIILVIAFFQIVVLQQHVPNISALLEGIIFTLLGLSLFVYGLELALFPIGETLAYAFVKKGSLFWLLIFSSLLGFSVTIAEPALIAVANKAAEIAKSGGVIADSKSVTEQYAKQLRYVVAIAVSLSAMLGVFRIIKGWPIYYIVLIGYMLVMIMTFLAPDFIIGVAYDIGGVTTSTITVPLITAIGVGLASSLRNRNPLTDGFGMIAIATLMPIIAVLSFGIFYP